MKLVMPTTRSTAELGSPALGSLTEEPEVLDTGSFVDSSNDKTFCLSAGVAFGSGGVGTVVASGVVDVVVGVFAAGGGVAVVLGRCFTTVVFYPSFL